MFCYQVSQRDERAVKCHAMLAKQLGASTGQTVGDDSTGQTVQSSGGQTVGNDSTSQTVGIQL